jgi:SAM-dependent methyltransferase
MTKAQKRSVGDHNSNLDSATVEGFGDEWSRFTQEGLSPTAREQIFEDYFRIFPWNTLSSNAVGADIGCGSGRWAKVVAPRVGSLHLVDASADALAVARRNLSYADNVRFHHASVGALPLEDGSLDFAYSLGVLHHVPDTATAIKAIGGKLKPGAPLLLYLYYAFDNRGPAYRSLWKFSESIRWIVSRLPFFLRYPASQIIALTIYWPISRTAKALDWLGWLPPGWPLSYYRDKPLYVLRTDALDRFGTRLEQRFTRVQIADMMQQAGLEDIRFSDSAPYWCAVGIKG